MANAVPRVQRRDAALGVGEAIADILLDADAEFGLVGGASGPGACAPVQPGAAEVHRKAGTWFDDREIYQWFAANLHRVARAVAAALC